MKDLIERQAAIDEIRKCRFVVDAIEKIRVLPSAEKPFKLPEIYVAEGFDTVEDEDGNIGFGVYVPAENKIYVAGDVEDEIRARALLHEVCHWVQDMCGRPFGEDEANEFSDIVYDALPSAQPEVRPIDYQDCSNAMLKMWMDNVVTDGEYNRIMDKLNAHWGKKDG